MEVLEAGVIPSRTVPPLDNDLGASVGILSQRRVDGLAAGTFDISSQRSVVVYIRFQVGSKVPVFEDRSRPIKGKREFIL